jgi:hypothetical protein
MLIIFAAKPRKTKIQSPPAISAGGLTVSSMSLRRKTVICADCAFRTALSPIGNSLWRGGPRAYEDARQSAIPSEASGSSSLSSASPGTGTWRARRGAVAKFGETTEVADAMVPRETAPTAPKRGSRYVLDCYAAEAGGLNGFLEQIEQMDAASAKAFVKDLRAQHRYRTGVY